MMKILWKQPVCFKGNKLKDWFRKTVTSLREKLEENWHYIREFRSHYCFFWCQNNCAQWVHQMLNTYNESRLTSNLSGIPNALREWRWSISACNCDRRPKCFYMMKCQSMKYCYKHLLLKTKFITALEKS